MLTFPDAFAVNECNSLPKSGRCLRFLTLFRTRRTTPTPMRGPTTLRGFVSGGGRKLEISPDSSEHRPALSDRHELPINPPVTLCEQRTQGDSVSSCHFPTQKGALPSASPHVNRGRLGGSGSITKSVPRTPSVAPGTRNDLNFMPQRRCRRARAVRIAGNFELRRDPPF